MCTALTTQHSAAQEPGKMTSSTKVCSNHNLLGGAGRGGEAPTSVLSLGRQQQRLGGDPCVTGRGRPTCREATSRRTVLHGRVPRPLAHWSRAGFHGRLGLRSSPSSSPSSSLGLCGERAHGGMRRGERRAIAGAEGGVAPHAPALEVAEPRPRRPARRRQVTLELQRAGPKLEDATRGDICRKARLRRVQCVTVILSVSSRVADLPGV